MAAPGLGAFDAVLPDHSEVVAGGSYADVYFWIPAYDLIAACWFAAAFLLLTAICLPRLRRRLWQSSSFILNSAVASGLPAAVPSLLNRGW